MSHAAAQAIFLDQVTRAPRLPSPGSGATLERWRSLAQLASHNMAACKLAEAHWDAMAILEDLGRTDLHLRDSTWGVWASEHPVHKAVLQTDGDQAFLHGKKLWCTGADCVTHALLTCSDADGDTWFVAVPMSAPGITLQPQDWYAQGMRHSPTYEATFDHTPVTVLGQRSIYLQRPGFWHGGAGIAACWYGATAQVAQLLRDKLDIAQLHASAHLGAIFTRLSAARALLQSLAQTIDAQPHLPHTSQVQAVRALVRDTATEVMDRCARALGPGPLCMHADHAQRCADLSVWITQQHAEKDLEALGRSVQQEELVWTL